MHADQPATPTDASQTTSHQQKTKPRRSGRPRVLDDAKRREVCAFVAGGCELRDAAHYVNCSVNTIQREADRNPGFAEQLRNSEAHARLNPLRAMQRAMATHWRAAAWFLERTCPERFAKRKPGMFGAREARELMNEIVRIVLAELWDPLKAKDVERRIRGAFEYHIRTICDEVRDSDSLRVAMKFFEDKDRVPGLWADMGLPTPEPFFRSADSSRTSPSTDTSKPSKVDPVQRVRPEKDNRQPPNDRPRSETTAGATSAATHTQRARPADTGRPPDVRPGSPDRATSPTAGRPASGHSTTPKLQPKSNPSQPARPPVPPSPSPDSKPNPQTAPSKPEGSRGVVKRPGVSVRRIEALIRDLEKTLNANANFSNFWTRKLQKSPRG